MSIEALVALLRPIQFRGKVRLLDRLAPRVGSRFATIAGFKTELDLSEYIQRMVYLGCYERWETRAVRSTLSPGSCFVDVGANIGYFSLLASRIVGPTGRVVSVEPSTYATKKLNSIIDTNCITNIRLERIGLGAEVGEVTLYDPRPDNHSPTMLGQPGEPGVRVPVRRLDDCLDDWGIEKVDLLKIDVEGYEHAVFAGGTKSLASGRIRAVLCEFNAHWLGRAGTSSGRLRNSLLDLGLSDVTGSPWDEHSPLSNRLFRSIRPH